MGGRRLICLAAGGFLWEENRKRSGCKPFAIVQGQGRGTVIAFTADPGFRAMTDGLNVMVLNAIFRGPVHARPMGGE